MLTHRSRHVPRHLTVVLAAALALAATLAAFITLLLAAEAAGAATQRIWVRQYAPTAGNDEWSRLAKGPSGTIYVAGTRGIETGRDRIVVAKYTASGRRVWLRTFAGRGFASVSALAVDAHGRAYVVGQEVSAGSAWGHICVLKLASRTGKRVWVQRYDGPAKEASDFPNGMALGANGAVYVTGTIMTSAGEWNALLLKYTDKGARGARAWSRTYDYPAAPADKNTDRGLRVVVDSRGGVYWGGTSDDETGSDVVFLRRVKVATGKAAWTKRIWSDSGPDLELADLAAFPGGGVVLAANRGYATASGTGAYVSRYTAAGARVFGTLIDGPDNERVLDLAVGAAGDIAVAGTRIDSLPILQSAWVARGDRTFSLPWQAVYDSPQAGDLAIFQSVAVGSDGAVYCGGTAATGFITGWDFTMVKYSAAGVRQWVDPYDDLDASKSDACRAVLYVGGSKPGLYGAGHGGATDGGEAVLVKYQR